MTSSSIYHYRDYKDFLKGLLKGKTVVRGFQAKLARAAGCHSAYLSQVMSGHIHLTSDHVAGIAAYLEMDDQAHDYFQTLLSREKCASTKLKKFYNTRLKVLAAMNDDVSARVKGQKIEKKEDTTFYYSTWYYSAIHVLLSIPGFDSSDKIASRLSLPKDLVDRALSKLEAIGIVKQLGTAWSVMERNLHLDKTSPLIPYHHLNWRLAAADRSLRSSDEDLRYSVVLAISAEDYKRLKTLFLEAIARSREIINPSPEEELFYFGLDLYKV